MKCQKQTSRFFQEKVLPLTPWCFLKWVEFWVAGKLGESAPEPTGQGWTNTGETQAKPGNPGSRAGLSRATWSSHLTCQILNEQNTMRILWNFGLFSCWDLVDKFCSVFHVFSLWQMSRWCEKKRPLSGISLSCQQGTATADLHWLWPWVINVPVLAPLTPPALKTKAGDIHVK